MGHRMLSEMRKGKKRFHRKVYWTLNVLSVFSGIINYLIWTALLGHEGRFVLHLLNLLIFSIPIIIFFMVIRFDIKKQELNINEQTSLRHMGILSLLSGGILSLSFIVPILIGVSELAYILSYPEIFLMPLFLPLLLIILSVLLIRCRR